MTERRFILLAGQVDDLVVGVDDGYTWLRYSDHRSNNMRGVDSGDVSLKDHRPKVTPERQGAERMMQVLIWDPLLISPQHAS